MAKPGVMLTVFLIAFSFTAPNASAYRHPNLGRFISADPMEYVDGNNRFEMLRSNTLRFLDPSGTYGRDVHQELTNLLAFAAGFSLSDSRIIAEACQGTDEGRHAEMVGGKVERVTGGWVNKTFWDLWHLPGAFMDGEKSRVETGGANTQRILNVLRDAAMTGEYATTKVIENYGHLTNLIHDSSKIDMPEAIYELSFWAQYANGYREKAFTSIKIRPNKSREGRLRMFGVYLHSLQDSYSHADGRTGHKQWWDPSYDYTWLRLGLSMQMAEKTYEEMLKFLEKNPGYQDNHPANAVNWNKDLSRGVEKLLAEIGENKITEHWSLERTIQNAKFNHYHGKLIVPTYSRFIPGFLDKRHGSLYSRYLRGEHDRFSDN